MTCWRQRTHRNSRAERSIAVLGQTAKGAGRDRPRGATLRLHHLHRHGVGYGAVAAATRIETVAVPAYFGIAAVVPRISHAHRGRRGPPPTPPVRPVTPPPQSPRAAACLAALGRPGRRTSPVFVSHRQRRKQIRQTKKPTLPASERGSLPALTLPPAEIERAGARSISGLRLDALPQLLGFAVSLAPVAGVAGSCQHFAVAGRIEAINPGATRRGTCRNTLRPDLPEIARRIQHSVSICHHVSEHNRSCARYAQRGDEGGCESNSGAVESNVMSDQITVDLNESLSIIWPAAQCQERICKVFLPGFRVVFFAQRRWLRHHACRPRMPARQPFLRAGFWAGTQRT